MKKDFNTFGELGNHVNETLNSTKLMSIEYIKGARKNYFNEALRSKIRQSMQKYFIEEMCDMLEISLIKYNLKDCKKELDTIIEELKNEHYEVILKDDVLTISIPNATITDKRLIAGNRVRVTNKKGFLYNSENMEHLIGDLDTAMKITGHSRFIIVESNNNSIAISPNGKYPITGWVYAKDIEKDTSRGLRKDLNVLEEDSGLRISFHNDTLTVLSKEQDKDFCIDETAKMTFKKLEEYISQLYTMNKEKI